MLTVLVNQKYNEVFRVVCFLRIREKTLSQISYSVVVLVLEYKGL